MRRRFRVKFARGGFFVSYLHALLKLLLFLKLFYQQNARYSFARIHLYSPLRFC